MKELIPQIVNMLIPILMALGAWVSVQLTNWIRAKVKNETAAGVLLRLNDLVSTQVKANAQTVVAKLREAAEDDGEIDAEELAAIKDETIERIKAYLGTRGLKDLANVIDSDRLDEFLEAKVEQAVLDAKEAA